MPEEEKKEKQAAEEETDDRDRPFCVPLAMMPGLRAFYVLNGTIFCGRILQAVASEKPEGGYCVHYIVADLDNKGATTICIPERYVFGRRTEAEAFVGLPRQEETEYASRGH